METTTTQTEKQPKRFSDFGIKHTHRKFTGEKISLRKVLNTDLVIHGYDIQPSKYPREGNDKCLRIQFSMDGKMYVAFSIAKILMQTLQQIAEDDFPFTAKITNTNDIYEFK